MDASSQDGGYNVTADLWAKAVLKPAGGDVTLIWQMVGAAITPSGDQVISGYFYADPAVFAYGSPYNPEVFVKIYIAAGGWCNIAFNHVTVDNVEVSSAHQYGGSAEKSGTITTASRLAQHEYTGVSIDNSLSSSGTGQGAALSSGGGGYTLTSDLWAKAVLQVAGNPLTLIWKEVGSDTTPSGDRVVSGYFYADPTAFAYGSVFNPEVFVKVYIATNGWANMAFNHVTVDDVTIYSAHRYAGTPDKTESVGLNERLQEHEYTGVTIGDGPEDSNGNDASFSLTPEPAALNCTIPADGMATIGTIVQVVPSDDFTGAVTFTIEGVPDGVTATFSDSSSTTATSLQLTVTASAVQGSSILTVTGTSPGVADATTTLNLTLLAADKLPILSTVEEELRQYASQGKTPLEQAQSIAEFMRGRSEYVDAGVDEETLSAWGELQNGRLHVVSTAYFPRKVAQGTPEPLLGGIDDEGSTKSLSELSQAITTLDAVTTASSNGNALPGSSYARLLHSFGANFEGQDPINDVAGWLKDAGWKIRAGAEGDASLEVLKTVKGDGFFYINSHGGLARKSSTGTHFYCLSSSTIQNSALDETYKDDWDNYRIVYYTGYNGETLLGGLINDWDTWYGITYAFVEKYWSFAANSIVWINACHSQGSTPSTYAFRFACLQKGAGAYCGWTSTLSSAGAYPAIRYFVDRCLGANQYEPEYPAQRPFPWDLVVSDMTAKGHARGANGEVLVATPQTPGTPPSLLAPSIRLIEVDEYSYDMKLKGYFGSDRGEVSVGGTPVTIKNWDSENITCELPKDFSGDVQVKVRDLKSNPRPLTQWIVPLSYTWNMTGGVFNWTGTGELRYRLDVSGFRNKPGETPTYLRRGTWPVLGGGITVSLSGNVSPCTISGGTVTLPSLPSDQSPTAFILAPLIVDANTKTGLLGLSFGANPTPWLMICPGAPRPGELIPSFGKLPLPESFFYEKQDEETEATKGPIPAVNVTYGENMELNGGSFTDSTGGTMKVEWKNPTQTSPPRPDDAGI